MNTSSVLQCLFGPLKLTSALFLTAVLAANASAAESHQAVNKQNAAPDRQGTESAKSSPKEHGRLISLVVLLPAPRQLDDRTLTSIVSKALGIASDPDTVDKHLMVAKPPYYKVDLKSGVYVINNIDKPYFDNGDKLAKEIREPELRNAVTGHHAWISVDWAGKEEPADLQAAYSDMGKIAAALASPDALAIYSPEAGELSVFNDSVAKTLTSGDPLQVFDSAADETVSVSDDDPQIQAAQAKARKEWPEFTRAFAAKAGKNFAVNGRIVEGSNAEYMWLAVTSIDADKVHGTLDNAPVVLTNLKTGQDLHVLVSDVDDWIYIGADGKPVGGFTMDALSRARDKARDQATK